MALARRIAVTLAALVGLALTIVGAWFAIILGPKGTATFSATSNQPAVIVGPQILNRVNVPVTVTATAGSGPVFLGAAVPQDASEALGQTRHNDVITLAFPARALQLEGFGGEPAADPSAFHVWRSTGEGSITLSQDQAPEAVVVYAKQGGPVDLTVSYARSAWFLQALVALVVGLIVLAFAGGWLWQNWRPQEATGDGETHEGTTPPEEAQQRPEEAR